MPTLVADVSADIQVVVEALLSTGLAWCNPSTEAIHFWRGADQLVAETEAAAVEAWRAGGLVQLWREDGDDLAVGHSGINVRLFFDGCSARDVAIYLGQLASRGISYWVGPEE